MAGRVEVALISLAMDEHLLARLVVGVVMAVYSLSVGMIRILVDGRG
jgi:hypothetical protein